MNRWNDKEVKILVEGFLSGDSYDDLSNILNRTKKSVRLKLSRLGYNYKKNDKFLDSRICLECNGNFEVKKSNPKIFCSRSCSTKYNNKCRVKKNKKCLHCDNVIDNRKKYCNINCFNKHKHDKFISKWLSGEISGIINDENNSLSTPIRRYIFEKYGHKCVKCGWDKLNTTSGKSPLQIDHIDGNSLNSNEDNLTLLCPNCHSLTPTYGSLNRGKGRKSVKMRY